MIKRIVILKPKKSLNFSESCNVGITNSKNSRIFIANDDIIISKNTMEELVKHTNDSTITGPDSNCNLGFQTDYAYTVGGVKLIPAMLPHQISHIIPQIYNIDTKVSPHHNMAYERDWLAFFATMFTRKCFEDVGLMDETFVYDREDLDWCVRAKAKGKKFKQPFNSFAFHFGGVSRKVKHLELGLKHDLDTEHNTLYYNTKYGIKSKPILAFYCHDAWEYWDENSLNKPIQEGKPGGIGGSETQVILLSRELAKLGYKIKVFNKCKDNHMDSGGHDVEYIPFQDFANYSKNVHYDYLVASRYLDCFDLPFHSKRNFAMIHDVFLIQGGRHPHDVKKDRIEKYFCLSNAHKQFVSQHHNIPTEQIVMTSNGLDFSRFERKNIEKNPYRLIYSSSPDRGLEVLLPLFDRVKLEVPQVELHIYYGFENFRDQNYVQKILGEIDKRKDVHYHGRIGQDQLAEEMLKSTIWSFPQMFEETFCITAIEAMAAGTIPLASDWWGVSDTVKGGGILLPMQNNRNTVYSREYQDKWVEECIKLLKNKEYQEMWRGRGLERVRRFSWSAVSAQWDEYFRTNTWKEIQ